MFYSLSVILSLSLLHLPISLSFLVHLKMYIPLPLPNCFGFRALYVRMSILLACTQPSLMCEATDCIYNAGTTLTSASGKKDLKTAPRT